MMTNKAYIVANEQQEREVLEKLEREGYLWRGTDMRPTEKHRLIDEPITIFARDDKRLMFDYGVNEAYLADHEIEIVFDGRKEEQMSDKYIVSQKFMNTLNLWREKLPSFSMSKKFVGPTAIQELDDDIDEWWNNIDLSDEDNNNRLIAIIRWVNGEDVFEVEEPKKWVVRSKEHDEGGHYQYVIAGDFDMSFNEYHIGYATRFDTKEEAESWANSHQEVVQVEVKE